MSLPSPWKCITTGRSIYGNQEIKQPCVDEVEYEIVQEIYVKGDRALLYHIFGVGGQGGVGCKFNFCLVRNRDGPKRFGTVEGSGHRRARCQVNGRAVAGE